MAKIEHEIQQKQFKNEYIKAHINILFTASWINGHVNQFLKPFDLSLQQFNILRILRGTAPHPTSVKELTNRMIDKMSNASRLVEKLRLKGMVDRKTSEADGRRVDVTITELGLQRLADASDIVEKQLEEVLQSISLEKLIELNNILDDLRG